MTSLVPVRQHPHVYAYLVLVWTFKIFHYDALEHREASVNAQMFHIWAGTLFLFYKHALYKHA